MNFIFTVGFLLKQAYWGVFRWPCIERILAPWRLLTHGQRRKYEWKAKT